IIICVLAGVILLIVEAFMPGFGVPGISGIILLLAGMLLDAISIYYVFLPFMLPIMAHFNWDPVWFGIMMTVNLAVGQVTPPVAVNLYVGANISGISMERISKAALPLIFASLLALVVIILFPDLSTFVPRMLGQM
uniref:TRAP transporter large permease subunit n=1 Tax=Desulfovibrio sp. TaxID=885 RepID=UPI003FD77FC6